MGFLLTFGVIAALILLVRAADRWLRKHIADKEF